MYERYYGVKERPFTLLPDPEFLFLSDKHSAALGMLELAIANHSGFCVISGEIGAGKTTLIREILNRLDDSVRVGLVSNTHASFGELMQWVMAAYGLPSGNDDKPELHRQFIDFAIEQYAAGRHTLLIVDEAQNLSDASLEELRTLTNVNSDKDFVLQIMLVGQHQLRDKLKAPALAQFAQGIALDYHLEGLSAAETRDYIRHRLRHAGADPAVFSDCACGAVYQASGGVPRLINRLCDLCMVYGCTEERPRIDAALVNRVAQDQRMGRLLSTCETADAVEGVQAGLETESSAGADAVSALVEENDVPPVPRQAKSGVSPDPADGEVSTRVPRPRDAVEARSSVLPAGDGKAATAHDDREPEPAGKRSADLHELVVNAEKQRQTPPGERWAQWLLAAVVVLAIGTGWMTRGLWLGGDTTRITRQPVAATHPAPVARTTHVVSERRAQAELDEDTRPSDETAVREEAQQRQAEIARQAELEREAELQREAERLARLQEETARLELQRLETERKLAEQKVAREALERQAREERQRIEDARKAAEKVAAERERAEQVLSRQVAPKPAAPEREPQTRGVQVVTDAGESSAETNGLSATLVTLGDEATIEAAEAGISEEPVVRFSNNPCNGPTARFMSTCR